ncbi:hypothetical protein KCU64_g33, partial [Aureobasidium melanogenum]
MSAFFFGSDPSVPSASTETASIVAILGAFNGDRLWGTGVGDEFARVPSRDCMSCTSLYCLTRASVFFLEASGLTVDPRRPMHMSGLMSSMTLALLVISSIQMSLFVWLLTSSMKQLSFGLRLQRSVHRLHYSGFRSGSSGSVNEPGSTKLIRIPARHFVHLLSNLEKPCHTFTLRGSSLQKHATMIPPGELVLIKRTHSRAVILVEGGDQELRGLDVDLVVGIGAQSISSQVDSIGIVDVNQELAHSSEDLIPEVYELQDQI